jgi:opacity protein-like surface antigen
MVVLFFANASTQSQPMWHIKMGGVKSNWRGDGMSIFNSLADVAGSDFIHQQGYNSFYVGASVQLPLADRISIEPGLQYSRVGASLQGNLAYKALSLLGIKAGLKAVSQRVELPVMVKAEVAKGLHLIAGPQLNYAFDNEVKLQGSILGINPLNTQVDINNSIEPLSVAAVGGVQYQFAKGFQLQATYEYGLTKIAKNNSADIYQNSFRIGMGIPISK